MFSSYFYGTYFISQKDFIEISDSIDALFLLFQRKSCGENVLHSTIEALQWNDTYLVDNGQTEMMIYFQRQCLALEDDYHTTILKGQPSYLKGDALDYLMLLENGNFCD